MGFVLKTECHHESEKSEAYLDQKRRGGVGQTGNAIYLSKETNVPSRNGIKITDSLSAYVLSALEGL